MKWSGTHWLVWQVKGGKKRTSVQIFKTLNIHVSFTLFHLLFQNANSSADIGRAIWNLNTFYEGWQGAHTSSLDMSRRPHCSFEVCLNFFICVLSWILLCHPTFITNSLTCFFFYHRQKRLGRKKNVTTLKLHCPLKLNQNLAFSSIILKNTAGDSTEIVTFEDCLTVWANMNLV